MPAQQRRNVVVEVETARNSRITHLDGDSQVASAGAYADRRRPIRGSVDDAAWRNRGDLRIVAAIGGIVRQIEGLAVGAGAVDEKRKGCSGTSEANGGWFSADLGERGLCGSAA